MASQFLCEFTPDNFKIIILTVKIIIIIIVILMEYRRPGHITLNFSYFHFFFVESRVTEKLIKP